MVTRILVLCLSFSTMICYGYALGGLGGYLFGRGKPLVIAAGLVGGTLCALMALRIWKRCLDEIAKDTAELERLAQIEADGTDKIKEEKEEV